MASFDGVEKGLKLEQVAEEMRVLVERAKIILRGTGHIKNRAEAYWLGHIEGFLEDKGTSCTSVCDTIAELMQEGSPDEDDEELE